MNGFIITLPSSRGEACFFVTPERVGQSSSPQYPWSRATYVATVFGTRSAAQEALDLMRRIHAYMAPELNGGLTKRLHQAQVLPVEGANGIELD
jgi:hypothetical protein